MPKIRYKNVRFGVDALSTIKEANLMIDEMVAQGYALSLRQLYYLFVARDLLPDDRRWAWTGSKWVRDLNGTKNADPNYKWLGDLIERGRYAGLVDWEAIEDRTRSIRENSHWDDPSDIIESAAQSYRNDLWRNQKTRCQVWIEKDALVGVIEGVCRDLDIPCFSCRGYSSASAMWRAAMRFSADWRKHKQKTEILHMGDHDPSGVDMTRDIRERLYLLSCGAPIEVRRIALTMSQVRQYRPPPNPAKLTDARAQGYIERYGDESWELDALEPRVLVALVRKHVGEIRNETIYQRDHEEQEEGRKRLIAASKNWDELDIPVDEDDEGEDEE